MIRRRAATFLVVGILLSPLGGCEPPEIPTSVRVEIGPSFSMTGSGRLASFTLFAPLNGQKVAYPDTDVASVVWQVQAVKGYFEGTRVQGLKLTYGKVPEGYAQTVPGSTLVAPVMQPGFVYSFLAESTGAPVAGGSFYLDKSGAVQALVPDLCLMQESSHKVRVNCATKKPFQDPLDLVKYVREHETAQ